MFARNRAASSHAPAVPPSHPSKASRSARSPTLWPQFALQAKHDIRYSIAPPPPPHAPPTIAALLRLISPQSLRTRSLGACCLCLSILISRLAGESSPRAPITSKPARTPRSTRSPPAQHRPSIVSLSHVLFAINLPPTSHGITQPQSPWYYRSKPPARSHGHFLASPQHHAPAAYSWR